MLIAEKDLDRNRKGRKDNAPDNESRPEYKIKTELKDIYKWIEYGFLKVQEHPNLTINCFSKAGVTENLCYEAELEEPVWMKEVSLELSEVSVVDTEDEKSTESEKSWSISEEENEGSEEEIEGSN